MGHRQVVFCGLDTLGRVIQLGTTKQLYPGTSEVGLQGTEVGIREHQGSSQEFPEKILGYVEIKSQKKKKRIRK